MIGYRKPLFLDADGLNDALSRVGSPTRLADFALGSPGGGPRVATGRAEPATGMSPFELLPDQPSRPRVGLSLADTRRHGRCDQSIIAGKVIFSLLNGTGKYLS